MVSLPNNPTPEQLADLASAMRSARVIYCHPADLAGVMAEILPTALRVPGAAPGITGPECFVADPEMTRGLIEPSPTVDPTRGAQA